MRTQVIYYLFHPSPDYTTDEAGGRLVIAALCLLECSHYGLQEPELLDMLGAPHQLDIVATHVTCQGDLVVQRHRLVAFAVKFLLWVLPYILHIHTHNLYLECLLTLIISHHIIIEC